MPPTDRKRLFLIDAMGYIFRAYFAPMDRLQTSSGIPTKVPYLFATMMRRLLTNKDRLPDYVAVAFDVSAPTFRDKLFAAYKAQRPPMPDDLSIQIPFVRRYCEAMRLPILEYPGYEADDVIGTLARLASKKNLDVFIVTSDKDLLQLVTENVLVLNPTKADLLIDEKKVEELMGVPPSKVADVMALMGDSIDNIPGARDPNERVAPGERRKPGIGEVGARQLIQQFGSAEETLKRASEVKRASYREALEKCAEFVTLSKKLATIPTDAPVALDLDAMKVGAPDTAALRELYAELGFTSLLRELAPLADAQKTDYASIEQPTAFKKFLDAIPPSRKQPPGSHLRRRIRTRKDLARASSASKYPPNQGNRASPETTPRTRPSPLCRIGSPIPNTRKSSTTRNYFNCSRLDRVFAKAAPEWRQNAQKNQRLPRSRIPSPEFAMPPCSIPIFCALPPRTTNSPRWCCAI